MGVLNQAEIDAAGGDPTARAATNAVVLMLASGTAAAAANGTLIQAALNAGKVVTCACADASVVYVADTLIVPSDAGLKMVPGLKLKQFAAGNRRAVFRTGTVELSGTHTLALIPLAHDTRAVAGFGNVRYTKSGSTTTLAYQAPGSAYGSEVPIVIAASGNGLDAASKKYDLTSANGEVLYVRPVTRQLPTADGTYVQQVQITPAVGATPVTAQRASGVVTVTQPNHRYRPGNIVSMHGNTTFDGLWIVTGRTANAFTYADARADAASAAAKSYAVFNIEIDGSFESGDNGGSVAAHVNTTLWFHANGVKVSGQFKTMLGAKYAGYWQGCSFVRGDNISFPYTASDGFTSVGPMHNVRWRNIVSACVDNTFGIGTSNTDNILIHAPGDAGSRDQIDIEVDGISPVDCEQEPVRLFGSADAKHQNIRLRRMYGKSLNDITTAAIWIFPDPLTIAATSGEVDGLLVQDVVYNGKAGSATQFSPVKIQGTGQIVRDLTLVRVRNLQDHGANTPSANAALVNVFSGASLAGRCILRDCTIEDVSTAGPNACAINLQDGVGAPAELIIDNIKAKNLPNGLVRFGSNLVGFGQTIVMVDKAQVNDSIVFDMQSNPKSIQISKLSGTLLGVSPALGYLKGVSGTTKISATQIDDLRAPGARTLVITTAGLVTVEGAEIKTDIAKIVRSDGAMVYNNNASANNGTDGAVGVGLFVCVGTASGSWKRVGTTGGAGNQY